MSNAIVEHNDVDITPLFSWKKSFEITDGDRTIPVFMRLLGDADINRARVASLRRSAEMRRKLKDVDSDERLAFIKDIDELSMESLSAVIIVFSMRELTDRATKNLKIRPPKAPRSDAKTEAHEKYQLEIDAYPEKRRTELRKLLEKEVEAMKKDLEIKGKEEVYKLYVKAMIDEMCEQELLKAFKEWNAYLSCYKDENLQERLFSTFDEFANIDPSLKEQFITEYSTIELHGDNLKKLRQVTP